MKKSRFALILLLILIITIISSFLIAKNLRKTTSQTASQIQSSAQAQKPSTNPIKRAAQVLGVWVGGEPEPSPTPSASAVAAKSSSSTTTTSTTAPSPSATNSPSQSSGSTPTPTPTTQPTTTPSPTTAASPSPTPTPIPTPNPATFDLQLESVLISTSGQTEDQNLKGVTHLQNNGTYVFDKPVHPYAITVYAKNLSPSTAANVTYTVSIDDEPTKFTKDVIAAGKSSGQRIVELPGDTNQHTVKVQIGTAANTTETNANNNSLKFIYKIKN